MYIIITSRVPTDPSPPCGGIFRAEPYSDHDALHRQKVRELKSMQINVVHAVSYGDRYRVWLSNGTCDLVWLDQQCNMSMEDMAADYVRKQSKYPSVRVALNPDYKKLYGG